jgi:hypothetical protein
MPFHTTRRPNDSRSHKLLRFALARHSTDTEMPCMIAVEEKLGAAATLRFWKEL